MRRGSGFFRGLGKFLSAAALCLMLVSCERKLGWGVLLWANEKTNIPSGTVLPVYIKSNIEKKWVVGIPKDYQKKDQRGKVKETKIEIPLAELELAGSKYDAQKYAGKLGDYALMYAKTMQNGLPIRQLPDNSSPRVYRLRMGEVIKILGQAEGSPAISAKGEPLPGEWYHVMTQDGTRGYCFSYRLSLFEHTTGPLLDNALGPEQGEDKTLESIKSKTWSPVVYSDMLNDRKFNIDMLSKHWGFTIGEDTGIANIYTEDIDQSFHYNYIKRTKDNNWSFEGTNLTMKMINEDLISVQFIDDDGDSKTVNFASLPVSVNDLIVQEQNRREGLINRLYSAGPEFSSFTFGKLTLTETAEFLWQGFEPLVPKYLSAAAIGRGKAEIKYNISSDLETKFDSVLTLSFISIGGPDRLLNFLYKIGTGDDQGKLTLEYVSPANIKNGIVVKEDAEPLEIDFYSRDMVEL